MNHMASLQLGSSDGAAFVSPSGSVAHLISYEGLFTATDGPADGIAADDIGVSESGSTPAGYGLQLTGRGNKLGDFHWTEPAHGTRGQVNDGQTFVATD